MMRLLRSLYAAIFLSSCFIVRAGVIVTHLTVSDYLTDATAPFYVDGSSLPDIDFDIGETYAGLLDIDSTGKQLFFWFVPSTNPSAVDEITIWLNGGPGCSSLEGFLSEHGPAVWHDGTSGAVRNAWAWSNLTNVVYIDQPVGAGYSRGVANATSSEDVARQFIGFWVHFMDLFQLHGRKVYLAGESFAGKYIPYISKAMLDQNDNDYFAVKGILLYDPTIGMPQILKQTPILSFIEAHPYSFPFNETFKTVIRQRSATCGYDSFMAKGMTFPPEMPLPPPPGGNATHRTTEECDIYGQVTRAAFEINPCFNMYGVESQCPTLSSILQLSVPGSASSFKSWNPYFNRSDVKAIAHVPEDANWVLCSEKYVYIGGDKCPGSGLTGGPLQAVIEATHNVIIGHGELDMVLLANGTLLTLQNLTWNGYQGFSKPPTEPFYVPRANVPVGQAAAVGILGSWVAERGLTYSTITLSGHEVPKYQPSASYRHLELLLGRIANLSDTSPLTTQFS